MIRGEKVSRLFLQPVSRGQQNSLLERTEGNVIGPGHAGITETSEYGLLFSFHYYDGEQDGEHALGIREVYFEDGWPQLGDWKIPQPE